MRNIIIGDIHGCFYSLSDLLDKLAITQDDKLYFTGDYFDRGFYSAKVYKLLKDMKNAKFIYGNHESMMLEANSEKSIYYKSERSKLIWYKNGGDKTEESFKLNNIDINEVIKWIEKKTRLYIKTKQFHLCHSGVYSSLETASEDELIWDRIPFYEGTYNKNLLIVGHTPISAPLLSINRDYTIYNFEDTYKVPTCGILGIDNGCVFGDRLTAAVIEDKEMKFVSVKQSTKDQILS